MCKPKRCCRKGIFSDGIPKIEISYFLIALIIFIAGCATNKVYVDTDSILGLGAEVRFPGGKVVPIKVKRVISGNMIELTNNEKVIYIGVYIPQLYNIPWQAKRLNKKLVLKNQIRLEFDTKYRDSKGRLLAYAYTFDGRFINADIIRQGLARVLIIPPNLKYKGLLQASEDDARDRGVGIWSKDFKK